MLRFSISKLLGTLKDAQWSGCSEIVERAHALLDTTPVDDWPRLENAELVGEDSALLLETDDGGLAEDDAVDCAGGRDCG